MRLTSRERQFRGLGFAWLGLFLSGTVITTVGAWIDPVLSLCRDEPLMLFTWLGHWVLLSSVWYLLNGLRDHERAAGVIAWFKVAAGLTMLAMLWAKGAEAGATLTVVGGGLGEFLIAALTLVFWVRARRSRALRAPHDEYALEPREEEPRGPWATYHRGAITICASLAVAAALVLLVALFTLDVKKGAAFMISSGLAVATFAALGFMGLSAARAPSRRTSDLDSLLLVLTLGAGGLVFWVLRFAVPEPVRLAYLVGAAVFGGCAVVIVLLGGAALRAQRPSRFFGAFLHRAFEKFAEVLIRGDDEVVGPREIADKADAWLAGVPSARMLSVKLAVLAIEFSPLLRGRPPMSRLGRHERAIFFGTAFRYGLFHDLIRLRSLIVLMYYSDKRAREQIGFVELEDRPKRQACKAVNETSSDVEGFSPTTELVDTDVCVIGTGAGGAVVAARLAGKHRVVMVEEGPYLKGSAISSDLLTMQRASYRDGGLSTSADFDLSLLQGRCVGGSTLMNNGICFEVPAAVLDEWDELQCALDREELAEAFSRVRDDLRPIQRLCTRPGLVEKGSSLFQKGCQKLGHQVAWFDVNLGDCSGCGYCTSGCFQGHKASTDRSYVPGALKKGAMLFANTKAVAIDHERGHAHSVLCKTTDGRDVRIRAKKIVVAGGAVHSSLLLLASGIEKNVGTRVSFNVGSWVYGEFRDPVDSFDGVQMCAYHPDQKFFIETMAMPPGVFAASMPAWFENHYNNMLRYRYFAIAGAMVPTKPVGRVRLHRVLGNLVSPLDFELPLEDLRTLRAAVQMTCKVWLAAGAVRAIPATAAGVEFVDGNQLGQLEEAVVEAEDLSFGSAHPQGGNPMSDDPALGAVTTDFLVYGFDNLYVADASIFPTALGVNPQLTIMAMADIAAQRIDRALAGQTKAVTSVLEPAEVA